MLFSLDVAMIRKYTLWSKNIGPIISAGLLRFAQQEKACAFVQLSF
jgi:hypothetical protein